MCPHNLAKNNAPLRALEPGLVVDVGSFDARDAVQYAKAGHQVLTIEPSPGKWDFIQQQIRAANFEGKISLLKLAMSNTTGTAPFVVNRAGKVGQKRFKGLGSAQDGLGAALQKLDNYSAATVEVQVRTLDEVVPASREVLYLKVDAQGYDYQVLMGAKKLLSQKRIRQLVFELMPLHMPGGSDSVVGVFDYMDRMGYDCGRCVTSHEGGIAARDLGEMLSDARKGHWLRGVNYGRWEDVLCVVK